MRDEDEIQKMADKASSLLSQPHIKGCVEKGGEVYDVEHLRGVRDALDWALDEDEEDDPL